MYTDKRPGGGAGGSGVGEGATYSPAGTADRYTVVGPTGATIISGELRRGAARGEVSIGTSNPVDYSGVIPGTSAPMQVHKNTASTIEGYAIYNTGSAGTNGGAGYFAGGGNCPTGRWYVQGTSAATFLGTSKTTKMIVDSNGGGLLIGTISAHNVVIGAQDAAYISMYPATNSLEISRGWGLLPVTINNAIHTVLTTQPRVRFTNLSVTRVCTLPAANAMRAGQVIRISVDSTGAAGVYVDITAAGSDNIGAGTTYRLDSAYETVDLETDGTSRWQVVGSS